MLRVLQRAGAWIGYRIIKVYWWIRRPIILGVRVLITDGNRVLLVRHTYREGWFLPGGRPNRYEPLAVTAHREAKEETGISVDEMTLLGVYSSLSGPESDHVVVFTARVQDTMSEQSGLTKQFEQSSEVDEARWVSVKTIPREASCQTELILKNWDQERHSIYQTLDG